jgi:hypothetical protein
VLIETTFAEPRSFQLDVRAFKNSQGGVLNVRNRFVLSLILAAVAVPLFANLTFGLSWFSHNSSMKSTNVDVVYKTNLANGSTLQPGEYKLEIPLNTKTPELKFFQNGRLVASVPAHVKTEARKASSTEIDYKSKGQAHFMTEVRPGGLHEALVLTNAAGMKSGS